jgi:hypothetical protein
MKIIWGTIRLIIEDTIAHLRNQRIERLAERDLEENG